MSTTTRTNIRITQTLAGAAYTHCSSLATASPPPHKKMQALSELRNALVGRRLNPQKPQSPPYFGVLCVSAYLTRSSGSLASNHTLRPRDATAVHPPAAACSSYLSLSHTHTLSLSSQARGLVHPCDQRHALIWRPLRLLSRPGAKGGLRSWRFAAVLSLSLQPPSSFSPSACSTRPHTPASW